VYYTTPRKVVPDQLGQQRIEAILEEEIKHMAIPHARLKSLPQGRTGE